MISGKKVSLWIKNFRPWETKLRRLNREYSSLLKMEKTLPYKDREGFEYELRMAHEEIEIERTRLLLKKSRKYDIPIPGRDIESDDVCWEYTSIFDKSYLNTLGFSKLRKAIEEAEDRAFERRARWVKLFLPAVPALTALIGVIIGLIGILR